MKPEIRLLKVFSVFALFIVESGFFFFASNQRKSRIISKYAGHLLNILRIRCDYRNTIYSFNPGLIVCNHISYVDILVLAKLHPALFITSVEVRNSFGIGLLARLAGCVFVERRSRALLAQESHAIKEALLTGTSVVLFPEGTSTNGEVVLNFHAALYQSAIDARVGIHHFYIQYEDPAVAYYGDAEFLSHLYRLCRQKPSWATLKYLGEMKPATDDDRKTIAKMSYEQIYHTHVSGISGDQTNIRELDSARQGRSHC